MDQSDVVDLTCEPSGCDEFDRARILLKDGREHEALDWFEIASDTADDEQIRRSACLFVASMLLATGRPHEVRAWTERVRADGGPRGLVALFEASAAAQFGEYEAALAILDRATEDFGDPWFRSHPQAVELVRSHALTCLGRGEEAREIVETAFSQTADSPDLWFALATLCVESNVDAEGAVAQFVEQHDDDGITTLFAWLRQAPAQGVDVIAEHVWSMRPDNTAVLAAATAFAPKLEVMRAVDWTIRLIEGGYTRALPVMTIARDPGRTARERCQASAIAAAFSEVDARVALEAVGADIELDALGAALGDVLDVSAEVADSLIVTAAVSTERCLAIVAELGARGHDEEALAVLVYGLSMDDADDLEAGRFADLVPASVRTQLAAYATDIGDGEIAAILLSLDETPVAGSAGDGA